MGLGDIVERALEKVGITPERVEKYLGRPCKCRARKRKLNELSAWALRVINGGEKPEEEFDKIVGDGKVTLPPSDESKESTK